MSTVTPSLLFDDDDDDDDDDDESLDNFRAALKWMKRGYNVVPQKAVDKKYPGVNWKELEERPVTKEELLDWYPKFANGVGFITGAISGVIVIETDGPEGETVIDEFECQHGPLPETLIVRSGSGRGLHRHFKHPGPRVTTRANPAIKVDIKGDGGFCVLPPSMHKSGGHYEIVRDAEPAALPHSLLEYIEAKAAQEKTKGEATRENRDCKRFNGFGEMPEYLRKFGRGNLWPVETCEPPPAGTMRAMLKHLADRNYFAKRDGIEKDAAGRIVSVGWRECGMALKLAYGDGGFELWAITHVDARAQADAPAQWASFAAEMRDGAVTIATLIKAAKGGGFVMPGPPEASQRDAELVEALDAADVDPTQFRRTDAGNALLFVAMFKENVRYVEPWRTWILWNGQRWVVTSDTGVLPLARHVTEHMFAWASGLPEDRREGLRRFALATQKEQRLRAMINIAKGESAIGIAPEQIDANPMLLCCPNGVVELKSGTLCAPKREDYLTRMATVAYNPQATCPNWLAALHWAMGGDPDTIEHIQRCAGYMLTGSVIEEKLFAFFGSCANGKTTVAMVLLDVFGDYATKGRKDILLQSQGEKGAASPDVAALQGKRLVVISETDDGCSLAEAQVKEITANEPIAARKLHRDPFTFRPSHKLLLLTNHRPFVKGTDEGIWRRLNFIGFNAKISEQDKDLAFREKMLLPEMQGILAWTVEGCLKWQRDGLNPSDAVRRAINEYRSEMDFVAQWLEDRCEKDLQATIARAEAYSNYRDWAQLAHLPTLGHRRFVEELRSRGFGAAKSNGVRLFCGLKLRQPNWSIHLVSGAAPAP